MKGWEGWLAPALRQLSGGKPPFPTFHCNHDALRYVSNLEVVASHHDSPIAPEEPAPLENPIIEVPSEQFYSFTIFAWLDRHYIVAIRLLQNLHQLPISPGCASYLALLPQVHRSLGRYHAS